MSFCVCGKEISCQEIAVAAPLEAQSDVPPCGRVRLRVVFSMAVACVTGVCKINSVVIVVNCCYSIGFSTTNNNKNTVYFANTGIDVDAVVALPVVVAVAAVDNDVAVVGGGAVVFVLFVVVLVAGVAVAFLLFGPDSCFQYDCRLLRILSLFMYGRRLLTTKQYTTNKQQRTANNKQPTHNNRQTNKQTNNIQPTNNKPNMIYC